MRIAIEVHPEPVPLGAVCFLPRAPAGTGLSVVRPEPVDPRMLLASTFNFVLMSPERQERLLDVCARAARGIVLQAELPPETTSAATATAIGEAVDRHARRWPALAVTAPPMYGWRCWRQEYDSTGELGFGHAHEFCRHPT